MNYQEQECHQDLKAYNFHYCIWALCHKKKGFFWSILKFLEDENKIEKK